MSGFDIIRCEMPLSVPGLGPGTTFFTRAFLGVFGEHYTIARRICETADCGIDIRNAVHRGLGRYSLWVFLR